MFALPPPDLRAVMERLLVLSGTVDKACPDDAGELTPQEIALALRQLEDVLTRTASEEIPRGISHLSDQGLQLIAELSGLAAQAGMAETAREIELLSFPFALWSVRQGASISVILPMVNALAGFANSVRRPGELAQMYRDMSEIIEGISPDIPENGEPEMSQAWRALVLNRAIVATRSHDPQMMKEAFDAVIERLPVDALNFFQEAMGQMDAIGYPEHVREVVGNYYLLVAGRPTIH